MQSGSADNLKGVDVSRWQGKIDWNQVKRAGKSFAYVKATEGSSLVDPMFVRNYDGVRNVGMILGVYHFARPAGQNLTAIEQDARRQAEWFLGAVQSRGGFRAGDLPPMLDFESNAQGLSATDLAIWIRAWRESLAANRLNAGIYTYPYFWESALGDSTSFDGASLWVANYMVTAPQNFGGWNAWSCWQYSDQGDVPGIAAPVDLDQWSAAARIDPFVYDGWLVEVKGQTLNGAVLDRGGHLFVELRPLAEQLGLTLEVDPQKRVVRLV